MGTTESYTDGSSMQIKVCGGQCCAGETSFRAMRMRGSLTAQPQNKQCACAIDRRGLFRDFDVMRTMRISHSVRLLQKSRETNDWGSISSVVRQCWPRGAENDFSQGRGNGGGMVSDGYQTLVGCFTLLFPSTVFLFSAKRVKHACQTCVLPYLFDCKPHEMVLNY